MNEVDKALEWFGRSQQGPEYSEQMGNVLAAEVRRLQAMLEPTPDARELASELSACAGIEGEPGHEQVIIDDPESLSKIAAHDARLLDEAAEKAKAYCKSYGFTFMVDQFLNGLDAAIKGAAHE